MHPHILALGLTAWIIGSVPAAVLFARMIGANDRNPQPFEGSSDARGGGVDRVSHHFGDM